jgi:hypothetical protein
MYCTSPATRSPFFSCLLPLLLLLFRPFYLDAPKDLFHALVIGSILLKTLFLLHSRQEPSILPQLPDGTLPLFLILFAKLGSLLAFMVGVTRAEII